METMEQVEESILEKLERVGEAVRSTKRELRQICSENEYVKGSTIRELYDRIEAQQREFFKLDEELTELENAY